MKNTLAILICSLMLSAFLVPCLILGASAAAPEAWEHYVYATDEKLTVDGTKESSYALGTIFTADLPETKTGYDDYAASPKRMNYTASYVWDGKGKAYCFVEVTDPDVVANDDLWAKTWYHCDSWQMYIDLGYTKTTNTLWTFVGEGTKKYTKTAPDDWMVVMTATGFNVEFCFDFFGTDFAVGDAFGFGLYYNDCFSYNSVSDYRKITLKSSSYSNPATAKYVSPNVATQDCMVISEQKIEGQTGTIQSPGTTTAPGVTTAAVTTGAVTTAATAANTAKTDAPTTTKDPENSTAKPLDSSLTSAPPENKGCGAASAAVGALLVSIIAPAVAFIRKKQQ